MSKEQLFIFDTTLRDGAQTQEWLEFKKKKLSITEADILKKIELRNKAREDKDYKQADLIRDELLDKGVLIEDKDGKTIWKFK